MIKLNNPKILDGDVFLFKQTSPEAFHVYFDGDIRAEYAGKVLDFGNDYETFYKDAYLNDDLRRLFTDVPQFHLFGCYEKGKFVVTDMTFFENDVHTMQHFEMYHQILANYNVHYRPPTVKFPRQKDTFYIHRVMDMGVWHIKSYKHQHQESWTIQ